jgi:hypothetical protein
MALDYTSWVATIANLTKNDSTDTYFTQILPAIIDYAEGRIYRDLDILSTVIVNNSGTLSSNTRDFTLPTPTQGTYDIIDQINLYENSIRTPLTPVSREVLDMLWPGATAVGTTQRPVFFAMTNADLITNALTISVGPLSGASVGIEVLGRVKPNPLSASNTTTYLTNQLPDLFIAASMIFASGWQANFGAQADDPRMSQSWETQYQALLQDADQNASRQKFAGASWTSKRVEPSAVPQRG